MFLQKSVRLVVNYLRTQKAVVRVSPEVPLHSILPLICAKCDVRPEHVVLLRDNVAGEELELSKSLSELGIKELYAWDNKRGGCRPRAGRWAAGVGVSSRCAEVAGSIPGQRTRKNQPMSASVTKRSNKTQVLSLSQIHK